LRPQGLHPTGALTRTHQKPNVLLLKKIWHAHEQATGPPNKHQSTSLEGSGLLSGVIIRGTQIIPPEKCTQGKLRHKPRREEAEIPPNPRPLPESLPPQAKLRLARSHHRSVRLARDDPRQIRQRRQKTSGEHSHLMHIPTPRSGTGAQ
jgi:hypothetical protein